MASMQVTLTQREAAHRQLATAVRTYFDDGDPVAIHTLAGAARELYEKHCEKAGIDRMFNHIQATHQRPDKDLWNILNGARNFFKHPSESLDDAIELRDSDNKATLFIACHDCAILCGEEQPIEVQVFNTWFMATEFPNETCSADREAAAAILKNLDSLFPGLRAAPPQDQKSWGRRLLAEASRDPKLASVGVAARVAKSESLIRWFDEKIDGVAVPSSLRSRLASGSLDAALEHQKAIVTLVAARLHGSALALVRLIFEAFIRGAWLHQCASDEDLGRFEKDSLGKPFGDLIKDLEKLEAFDCGVLLKAKHASWAAMNSYTHTGFHQVVRRNTETTIEANYSEAEIVEAISFADAIATMSAIEIAHIAGNDILANEIFKKVKDTFLRDGR